METIATGVHQVSAGGNAFIVDGDQGVALVDSGLPRREGAIIGALADIGRSIDEVVALVVTHGHIDHVGGAAALAQGRAIEVYASAGDTPMIQGDEPKPAPPFLQRVPLIDVVMKWAPQGRPVPVGHLVAEGSTDALPADMTVIDTPGHTDGHVSYLLDRDGGVLFVGDAAVAHRDGSVGRGWMNRKGPVFDASLRHLAESSFEIAAFGHAAPIRGGAADAFRRFTAGL